MWFSFSKEEALFHGTLALIGSPRVGPSSPFFTPPPAIYPCMSSRRRQGECNSAEKTVEVEQSGATWNSTWKEMELSKLDLGTENERRMEQ